MIQVSILASLRRDLGIAALCAAALLAGVAQTRAQSTGDSPQAAVEATPQPSATSAPAPHVEPTLIKPDGAQAGNETAGTDVPTNVDMTETPADGKVPSAEVDNPRFDFGETWTGGDLEHEFTIRNAGEAPLKILRVKPSCGCTAAGKYPDEIAPGESGKFPFKLNTSRLHGKFTKSITVSTNDPKNRQMQLLLTGEIKQFVEMEPKLVQFGRVKADTVSTSKVTLTNNTNEELKLAIDPNADLKCFSAKLEETVPGKQYELTVTAKPPFETGINRVTIPVRTGVEKQPTIDVTVIATLPQRIEFRPDKIQIAGPARAESERRVLLTNNGDEPLHVKDVASTDSRLTVESTEIEAGQKYQLAVKIPANYTNPAADAAIVIKTDDAKEPELRIPVVGRTAPRVERPTRPAMTMVGESAPESATHTYDGKEITIGGKHDKVQFVTFYASWCGFCKKALPKIEELQEKYKDNPDVQVIAVNLDDRSGRRARTEEETINHYKEMKLTMPMVMDSDKAISRPYKVSSFPTMFVIGKSGEVEAVHVGAAVGFENTVTNEIEALLAGKTRADFADAAGAAGPTILRGGPTARTAAVGGDNAEAKSPEGGQEGAEAKAADGAQLEDRDTPE